MRHHWDGGWSGASWLLMGLAMLIFWALVVALIVWVVRSNGGRPYEMTGPGVPLEKSTGPAQPSARDILDERYARGEIGDEEYRTRRDTLAGR